MTSLSTTSRSSVDRAATQRSEGHGFDSHRGIETMTFPTPGSEFVSSLVPRPIPAILVRGGGFEPGAIARPGTNWKKVPVQREKVPDIARRITSKHFFRNIVDGETKYGC